MIIFGIRDLNLKTMIIGYDKLIIIYSTDIAKNVVESFFKDKKIYAAPISDNLRIEILKSGEVLLWFKINFDTLTAIFTNEDAKGIIDSLKISLNKKIETAQKEEDKLNKALENIDTPTIKNELVPKTKSAPPPEIILPPLGRPDVVGDHPC